MTIAEGTKEQALTMLKLEHQKEKALLRAEMTEERRTLEEKLINEKRSEIDVLDQKYRDESMKMMESQESCFLLFIQSFSLHLNNPT